MFEDIVETAREPLVVLDADLKVLLASRSFYDIVQGDAEGNGGQFNL